MEVELKSGELVLRPLKSIGEVAGIFKEYAVQRSADWETVRSFTEETVAGEVADAQTER